MLQEKIPSNSALVTTLPGLINSEHTMRAVLFTRPPLLDIGVTVTRHSYLHVMAEERDVNLKNRKGVMDVEIENVVSGIVMAIRTMKP